jgi:hypothetical protein
MELDYVREDITASRIRIEPEAFQSQTVGIKDFSQKVFAVRR